MNATRIKMRRGHGASTQLLEIDEIYIDGIGYHKREVVYDHLQKYPGSITVGIAPFSAITPAMSSYDEKYVRSDTNAQGYDNLLDLPKDFI